MDWTDCALIEVVPGRMSGAPVLRNTRVRPQDLIANIDEGAAWLAEAHGLDLADVQAVLSFYRQHQGELPEEYIAPERISASRRHAPAI
jgi:uncharacterized protein (DUF433 family)